MAGELLNAGYAVATALVALVGILATMMVTDAPDDSGTASGITAIAVVVFAVALAASVTL